MKRFLAFLAAAVCTAVAFCAQAKSPAPLAPDPASEIYLGGAPSVAPDGSFFVFDWCNRIWKAPLKPGRDQATAVPLTDGRAPDSLPIVSPDGRRIAFLSLDRGANRIFELDIASPSVRRRISDITQYTEPCGWTADGKSIVAVAERTYTSLKDSTRAILVSTAPGAPETLLFDARACDPAMSPDMRSVLFSTGVDGTQRVRRGSKSSAYGRIWLFDRKTGAFKCVVDSGTDARSPCWLPDSDSFVYAKSAGGARNLWFHRISDGTDFQLTFFTKYNVIYPSVSADGGTVVFRNGLDFWKLSLGGGALAKLEAANRPARKGGKAGARKGASAARGKKNPPPANLKAVRLRLKPQGGVPAPQPYRRELDSATNLDSSGEIAWTADGSQVAFTSGGVLWTMDAGLCRPAAVHDDPMAFCRSCAFSPDGKKLYWIADRGDGSELWSAVRADASLPWWENRSFDKKLLLRDRVRRECLDVSPDGRMLSWTDCYGRLYIASAKTGKTLAALPPTGGHSGYAWHPSGRIMAFTMRDRYRNSDVWLAPLPDLSAAADADDPKPVEIPAGKCLNVSRHYKFDGRPAFSPDGKVLAYLGDRSGLRSYNVFYAYLDAADERADNQSAKALANARKNAMGGGNNNKKKGECVQDDSADDSAGTGSRPEPEDASTSPVMTIEKNRRGKRGAKPKKPASTVEPSAKGQASSPAGAKPAAAAGEKKDETPSLDPELPRRVRRIKVETEMSTPLFGPDSRSILLKGSSRFTEWDIAKKVVRKTRDVPTSNAQAVMWLKQGDKVFYAIGGVPAVDGRKLRVDVHLERSAADRNELAFRMMWGTLRDMYYDAGHHGVDWDGVRGDLLPYARNAPCAQVFARVVSMMNGLLDSSHTGYSRSSSAMLEWGFYAQPSGSWKDVTYHLGVEAAKDSAGLWRVTREYPDTPLASQPVRPSKGDVLLEIDGRPMSGVANLAQVATVPKDHTFRITFTDGKTTNTVQAAGAAYDAVRGMAVDEAVEERTRRVHKMGRGKVGYIYVKAMSADSLREFEDAVSVEAYGREALVVDVRDNGGGYITDHLLDFLCGPRHARSRQRGAPEWGYDFARRNRPPLADLKLVILANENSFSNAEIFSHAIKHLKRGVYVGMPTGGYVIGTYPEKILDYGSLRIPVNFWVTADGIDMENHGAEPDIIVPLTPADEAAGRDPQLDKAVETALKEIKGTSK